jgi:CRISPR system Cascade subunit CasB
MSAEAASPEQPVTLAALVNTLAGWLAKSYGLTPGDLAALRRMDARHPPAAFFKLEGLVLDAHLPGDADKREDSETRWAVIVQGLAHLGTLHAPRERLGGALAEAGFSELRFARLLQANADQLIDELPLLARFLAAKGVAADWAGAARLILSAGRPDQETARRHLARDYYGAVARAKSRRP